MTLHSSSGATPDSPPMKIWTPCARFEISSDPPRGSYDLAVAVDRIHFFDLESGRAIR